MVLIKKRNFKPYILNWLLPKLDVGLSIGNIFYVAEAASAMEDNLKLNGVPDSEIYHSLVTVEDAMTAGNNDVALVCPGTYTETVETDWDKRYCHMVGLGGPNVRGYDTYGTQFYSTTITVAKILHLTGQRCQFHNITFANNGANAACLSAFTVDGYGARLKNCQFIGMMAATQCDTTLANSLDIAGGAYYLEAENCIIGSTEWATQGATTNAPLMFSNTVEAAQPQDGKFTNCKIQSVVAATTRPLIYVANNNAIGRDWIFDRCEFYAFYQNHVGACAQVITDSGNPKTHDMVFKDCVAINCTAYRTASNGCTWASGGGAAAAKTGVAIVTT